MLTFSIDNLLPKFLTADRNGNAMAKAVEAGLTRMCETNADGIGLISNIDTMPSWRCNEVAWEYGADWYDSTADIAEKRSQVKSIYAVFSKIGTKAALIDAVESLFGAGCFVKEWFEYSGQPYHYKVIVTSERSSDDVRAAYMRLSSIVTDTRSVLDSIQYLGAKGTADNLYTATKAMTVLSYDTATAKLGKNQYDTGVIGVGMLGVMTLGKGVDA